MAEAFLERFMRQGAWGIITTHYGNIKDFAELKEGIMNAAMELGLDVSTASEIDRIGNQLVIVLANLNEGYYHNMGDISSGNVDYFGVLYDLPDLTNPREFTLPGKFHGVYKNKLLITDNYGAEELQLSFYEFVQK